MKTKIEWTRHCPNCFKLITYTQRGSRDRAERENYLCKSCAKSGKNHPMYGKEGYWKDKKNPNQSKRFSGKNNPMYKKNHTEETKQKMSKSTIGHTVSEETKQKMSKSRNGKPVWNRGLTKENNQSLKRVSEKLVGRKNRKHSEWMKGENNPMYKKHHTEETKRKIKYKAIKRYKNPHERLKMRITILNMIENRIGQIYPNYNPHSIPILEAKAKELGITDLQHAENGGEFYIEELGYWVDGYSEKKNIVIEYYEKAHKNTIEHDTQRQKEIEEYLDCKFIIIKE